MRSAGLFDLTPFCKLDVAGPDALGYLERPSHATDVVFVGLGILLGAYSTYLSGLFFPLALIMAYVVKDRSGVTYT